MKIGFSHEESIKRNLALLIECQDGLKGIAGTLQVDEDLSISRLGFTISSMGYLIQKLTNETSAHFENLLKEKTSQPNDQTSTISK